MHLKLVFPYVTIIHKFIVTTRQTPGWKHENKKNINAIISAAISNHKRGISYKAKCLAVTTH